jgi:hypothetical protein
MTRVSSNLSIFLLFALLVVCTFAFTPAASAQVAGPNVNMVSGTSWPGGDPSCSARTNHPSPFPRGIPCTCLLAPTITGPLILNWR